ncbi:MAG: TrkA family potassium uptake protein [Chloroherpetonaceae bacterium]|nr:TrkA family potassium uptake protein [Chloroherpetonaceae bacterium]MDW8436987.1 TrkA family potassium uptake protein [Chloroherpetonaceae bacterium]
MTPKIAVIGIGNFGAHLCAALARQGAEVLAIDSDINRLDDVKDKATLTVRLDSTEEEALRAQDIMDFDAVVVGIGDDFEAALLTIVALQNIGAKRIIARATTTTHERILRHLGIEEIISPAAQAAERLADSLLYPGVTNLLDLSSDYSIVEIKAPESFVGKSVGELELRERFNASLIAIKRQERESRRFGLDSQWVVKVLGIPSLDDVVKENDALVLFAEKKSIEKICDAT